MQALRQALKQTPLVYVTRDLERATGLVGAYKGYHIITNDGPFAKGYAKTHKNVLVIKGTEKLDTRELLVHPKTVALINKLKNPAIVVFKNTKQIEAICTEKGWKLLNPSATLASRVEEKISQLHWLGELQKYLPPHHIQECKDLLWSGEKYIIQFNHAHTGGGTILIESQQQIDELKKTFPNREVRVTQFVSGPAFTNNNIVWGNKIFCGNVSYQITGLAPFTTLPFATIGNDWALPAKLLKGKLNAYHKMVTSIGKKLAADGWNGLFGVDTILDEKTGKLYLIEINARQPASTTFESQLQKKGTAFEAHLAALLGLTSIGFALKTIKDGAQIIQRITAVSLRAKRSNPTKKLQALKLNVIEYNNTDPGSDWLRIQSKKSLMTAHNQLNKLGEKIKTILE